MYSRQPFEPAGDRVKGVTRSMPRREWQHVRGTTSTICSEFPNGSITHALKIPECGTWNGKILFRGVPGHMQ